MDYMLFGSSGLRVSELALGTMTFGEDWGWGASEQESKKVFDAYAEAGGNFIDTANRYTEGTSEKLVGKFIAADRDHFVLATKFTLYTRRDDPNFSGNHRKNMMKAVEDSLTRLGTDYIDLYWLHAWDFTTGINEVLRGLDDLVRQGKIHYIGISDTPAWVVSRANAIAELRGWTSFAGLQVPYSLLERTVERELLPMANALGMAVTPWGSLGSGVLTGKFNNSDGSAGDTRVGRQGGPSEEQLKIAGVVVEIANELGVSPSQVAVSWVRQQPGTIIPIIGARKESQIKDNLGSLDVTLSPEHLARLDEASAVDPGFPHSFTGNSFVRDLVSGGTMDRVKNHPMNVR